MMTFKNDIILKDVRCDQRGQSMMEYIAMVGIIMVVLVTMGTMIRRGTQGILRTVADQVGRQEDAEQKFDEQGHLMSATTITRTRMDQERKEDFGAINYIVDDRVEIQTITTVNAGFNPSQGN